MDKICKSKGLSSFMLSCIAAASMTVDHAAVIFTAASPIYYAMRAVGRIAFVVFAFLIAQSVDKTSSVKRFCLRLAVFAVLSEPIFDRACYQTWFYSEHQNVFFTLLASVICCCAIKRRSTVSIATATAVILAAQFANTDYGGMGVLLIVAFYLFGKNHLFGIIAVFAVAFIFDGGELFDVFAIAAVPLLTLYNGERGGDFAPKLRKWFFYVYYPAHLFVLMICAV